MENKLQPLNYCRQIRKIYEKKIAENKNYAGDDADEIKEILRSYTLLTDKEVVKFKLPIDGILIDDPTFKGLDNLSQVRLPYKKIILEYERSEDWCLSKPKSNEWPRKTVLICEEYAELNLIRLTYWGYFEDMKLWGPSLPVFINLEKTYRAKEGFVFSFHGKDKDIVSGYQEEILVLYGLLNALACSNVKIEKLAQRKPPKSKKMDALPFDDYHVLTVSTSSNKTSDGSYTESFGDRHAPREHLRRGHIRRLQDGRKIWVNAAVINAGSVGKVRKNYVAA